MDKNTIISKLATDNTYKDLCYSYSGGSELWEDLYQFIFLSLLEIPEARLIEINNRNIKGYISRMIWINWVSPTSPFRRQYDFNYQDMTGNELDEYVELDTYAIEVADEVIEELTRKSNKKNIYAWQPKLFQLYVESGCMREVARMVGIPYPTVRHNLIVIIKKINERITYNNTKTYRN